VGFLDRRRRSGRSSHQSRNPGSAPHATLGTWYRAICRPLRARKPHPVNPPIVNGRPRSPADTGLREPRTGN